MIGVDRPNEGQCHARLRAPASTTSAPRPARASPAPARRPRAGLASTDSGGHARARRRGACEALGTRPPCCSTVRASPSCGRRRCRSDVAVRTACASIGDRMAAATVGRSAATSTRWSPEPATSIGRAGMSQARGRRRRFSAHQSGRGRAALHAVLVFKARRSIRSDAGGRGSRLAALRRRLRASAQPPVQARPTRSSLRA